MPMNGSTTSKARRRSGCSTDLAEFLGGAIGLSLLLGMPLLTGMVLTGIATYAILALQRGGFHPIEQLIGGLGGGSAARYLVELLIAPAAWWATADQTG